MSIQDAREKIAHNVGALAKADPAFAKSVSDRYEAMKAKGGNPHPADLRRLQGDVTKWAEAHVSKPGAFSAEAAAATDAAYGWRDLLQAEIDTVVFSKVAGPQAGAGSQGWMDAATGKPMRVLASGEKLSSGSPPSDLTMGEIMASFVQKSRDPGKILDALGEGIDTTGGYSAPTFVLDQFFDKLRARTQFINAGAQTLMLEGYKTRIMRVTTDPVPAWRAENAAVAISDPAFDVVEFQPRMLAVVVYVSVELLQDSVNIETVLENMLLNALATELDRVCLFGSGTAPEPRGLFNTSGIGTVSMGTNGAAPTNYDPFLDAAYTNQLANSYGDTAAIFHPRTGRTLAKLKDTTTQPLRKPEALADLKMLTTTSVPITQTQGTASGISSTILQGDFTQGILGIRQELKIEPTRQNYASNLQMGFIATMRADVQFAQPSAFTKVIGVL